MKAYHQNGKMFDERGFEFDPVTGKVLPPEPPPPAPVEEQLEEDEPEDQEEAPIWARGYP